MDANDCNIFDDAPRTSSFRRDKRPFWYSTSVCKAAGGRNFPNPSFIEYGRGIRLWMFLVPKCDLRTDRVREFVETRRRHEAMFRNEYKLGIRKVGALQFSFFFSWGLFLVFDYTCFFQKLPPLQSHVAVLSFLTTFNMPPKATATVATNPVNTLWKAYNDNTPNRLKFIDSFLFFLMLSGIVQFAYCILVSNFPYNAFLSG